MTHDGKLGCKMSPNDENEQLSTRSDKFELGKGTPSELCRVSNLSDFGAFLSYPIAVCRQRRQHIIFVCLPLLSAETPYQCV